MAPQSDPPPSRAGRECFIHRFVDRDQVSALRRPFVERTHAAKASIPSSSVSKRIEWNRSNECCAPGSSAYTTGCDETCRSLARGLRIRSFEGGSRGLGGAGTKTVAGDYPRPSQASRAKRTCTQDPILRSVEEPSSTGSRVCCTSSTASGRSFIITAPFRRRTRSRGSSSRSP